MPDARLERDLQAFADDMRDALGDTLLSLVVYGSAATDDWVAGRSDVNVLITVRGVSAALLDVLAVRLPAWRRRRFALPLVVDEDFLRQAVDVFPMELDDMRRAHRTIHGPDVVADLAVDRVALRRQCEHEARAKLLRLRALYLDAAARPQDVENLVVASLTTFLVILRHVVHLRGDAAPHGHAEVLAAGERFLGPLPAMRRALEQRRGEARPQRAALREEFARYLADAERVVAAVDTVHA
jgi:predicted nucleotidyltransferase